MSDRADALRYARELFDVTWRHGQAPAVADELETIVLAARDYQEQVRPLFHPLVPKASKLATIRAFTHEGGHQQADGGAARSARPVSRAAPAGPGCRQLSRALEQEARRRPREGDDGHGAAGRQGSRRWPRACRS